VKRCEGVAEAQRRARRLHRSFGVSAPEHVRVKAFAANLGATIVVAPLAGAAAQLIRRGRRSQIVLASRITDRAAQRFSIAHELGHLVLDHPSQPWSEIPSLDKVPGVAAQATANDERDLEREANAFAAELLMPAALVRDRCEADVMSLDVSRQIAAQFRVSILASAIRVAELATSPCAAVLSDRGVVRWSAASATFPYRIDRGWRVARPAPAGEFFATGAMVETPQPVPATVWTATTSRTPALLMEHSTGSAQLGTVLSMLWSPDPDSATL
jgi:hypothetical protein